MQADRAADLAIVGAGPAGLSAAIEARRLGLMVTILEREAEAGGAPRHCGHTGFGMRDLGRVLTGPRYAERLRGLAEGLDLRCGHAVTAISPGAVSVSGPGGPYTLPAHRILLATGIRERPRAPRLVTGGRPFGILTTGALQRFVYLHGRLPCRAPVIIGSEAVALSAILTLRHLGGRPAAILEAGRHLSAPGLSRLGWFADRGARLMFGVPILRNAQLLSIHGETVVKAVEVRIDGRSVMLDCDGVVFSGGWIPEATLARQAGLTVDPERDGPRVDLNFRSSRPAIFAAGNVLGAVRSSGPCAIDGRRAARAIAHDLDKAASP